MTNATQTHAELLQAALAAWQSGDPDQTETLCRQVLAAIPEDENALHLMGLVWQVRGKHSRSASFLERARSANPDNPFIHYNLGVTMQELGQSLAAERCYRRALELKPDLVPASHNLARLLLADGRPAEAESACRAAIAAKPDMADTHLVLGNVLKEMLRWDEAADCYQRAIRLRPDYAEGQFNLGVALQALERHDEAIIAFTHFLRSHGKEHPVALNKIGLSQRRLRRLADAVESFSRAVQANPGFAGAWNNLGMTFDDLKRHEAAKQAFAKALEAKPDFAEAAYGLGCVLDKQGMHEEALRCCLAATGINPDLPHAATRILKLKMALCDWPDLDAACSAAIRDIERRTYEGFPFDVLYVPDTRPPHHLYAGRFATATVMENVSHRLPEVPANPRPIGRLRMGYVSSDLREHAVAQLTASLFELHDRNRFEVFAYSSGPDDGSEMRQRLQRAFDHFIDIRELSHEQAARRIRDDAIDILVDLNGYTRDACTEIFAMRPAPIQVNWLGYPGTMGADFMDYIVVDPFVVPPEQAPYYTEKLAYLPDTYLPNDRKRAIGSPPTRAEVGLPEQGFVFCCFNNAYKITPDVFEIWCGLLDEVAGAVLWLSVGPEAQANLRREAEARGIDPERLIFASRVPSMADHLARLSLADLFLDTLPYNAHTTAPDALWAGVPVVTCAGETFPSRVAGSLLRAVGLPELVTERLDQYRDLALRLATHPDELRAIQQRLAENRLTTPLFDSERFTRNLEALYRRMWARHEQGLPPAMLETS
jgi:predicted O-linked N-acetylglucosamine transferase (SPINDLY family)